MQREQIAKDTVQILGRGEYCLPDGRSVNFVAELRHCVQHTQCYEPATLDTLRDRVLAGPGEFPETVFDVVNETTLQGSARLASDPVYCRVGVLNFASARNPGGGFLTGAHAQEESLARSSGLYQSLLRCPAYYAYHRSHRSGLYSDRMIYSPRCPVFRADDGMLLDQVYCVDFITSPAPNAGAIAKNEPGNLALIEDTLRERASKILALAAHHACDALVLGAWGCGVFRNDPVLVAEIFAQYLGPGGSFWGRFRRVLFSVLDISEDQAIYYAFRRRF
ncbi:MAG: TIGR02452 family protein [Anaerolineae bacterium]|nr:TIGR02452 family protein [Anaerolineae bacterium]